MEDDKYDVKFQDCWGGGGGISISDIVRFFKLQSNYQQSITKQWLSTSKFSTKNVNDQQVKQFNYAM